LISGILPEPVEVRGLNRQPRVVQAPEGDNNVGAINAPQCVNRANIVVSLGRLHNPRLAI